MIQIAINFSKEVKADVLQRDKCLQISGTIH